MAVDLERLGRRAFSAPVVIFALHREAAPFLRMVGRDRLPVRVFVSGMGREAARAAAERACAAGRHAPRLVVAAGFCGALRPGLRVGDVVVTSDVTDVHAFSLPATLRHAAGGRVLTMPWFVPDPAEKLRLHSDYDADVVDMESAGVAEVCEARGLPFAAVRAVSDAADTALSPRLAGLLSGGRVSPLKAAWAVARRPALLAEFRRLARDTKVAARALAGALRDVIRS